MNTGSAFSQNAHNVFAYNDRGEVVESKRFLGTDPQNPGSEVTNQRCLYDFDAIGNRDSHTSGTGSPVSYTANQLNQYAAIGSDSLVHDKDGNLIEDGDWIYKWDGENRLVEVAPSGSLQSGDKRLTFAYDYMGRRVKKLVETWNGSSWSSSGFQPYYVWHDWTQRDSAKMDSAKPEPEGRSAAGRPLGGKRVNLIMVVSQSNPANVAWKYTWGLDIAEQWTGTFDGIPGSAAGGVGGLLGVDSNGTSWPGEFVVFYDGNGNVTQILEHSSQTVVAHYEYDPFGNIVNTSGGYASMNPFRFRADWG